MCGKMGSRTREIIQAAMSEDRQSLLEAEAKQICADYGMSVPSFELARTAEEACNAASKLGFPVVLKIVSKDILHKTDAGGVLLNIKSLSDTGQGFSRILMNAKQYDPKAEIEGVLVQKMMPQSTEVIIGGLIDPQFGQTLMFGLGGIFVEILRDVTFRIAPITEQDARQMIHEISAYPILKGYRGQSPADEEALVYMMLKASDLVMENPEINQMDLNPVMIYEKGASIVDARMLLRNP